MDQFVLKRLGLIMKVDPESPDESGGVLNPACVRGKDGELYLFPRLVGPNNYSRIGVARVKFNSEGDPYDVERLGIALQPDQHYEQNQHTAGCEDPRVVYIEALDRYVMTYSAYGPMGPRIALAVSNDLVYWERLGPVVFAFEPNWRMDFNLYSNKDAIIFPEPVLDPAGRPAIAMLHRPTYDMFSFLNIAELTPYMVLPTGITDPRASMWLSYCPLETLLKNDGTIKAATLVFDQHHLFMTPVEAWENVKIGGGTPPVKTKYGWVCFFHGVSNEATNPLTSHHSTNHYAAGALVLDLNDPRKILYRSSEPVLSPKWAEEREGVVSNVVFPTGIDLRENGRLDVYYGMADQHIGAATLNLPDQLPVSH